MFRYLVSLHHTATIREFSPYFSKYDNSRDFIVPGRQSCYPLKCLGRFDAGIRRSDVSKYLQHSDFVPSSLNTTSVTTPTKNSRKIKPQTHLYVYYQKLRDNTTGSNG